MSKIFLIFKRKVYFLVVIVLIFHANLVLANEWTFTDNFGSYGLGSLNEQGGWAVTNYYGNIDNTVNVSASNPDGGPRYVEITNNDSLIVAREIAPVSAGIFQFRMRHDKAGLFYAYALTSDAGGQLLFSIQFTESDGILLEEADTQITLLPDYVENQWYLFTIDFDGSRGERGAFRIKIDDGDYNEYGYVDSESTLFDFGQIVFGSDSDRTSISAFSDIESTPIPDITSIVSDLNDGQVITTTIDGDAIISTAGDTASSSEPIIESIKIVQEEATSSIQRDIPDTQDVVDAVATSSLTSEF